MPPYRHARVTMSKLEKIPGLSHDAVELLEAAGYLDVDDLCGADTTELTAELVAANDALGIMTGDLTEKDVLAWKKAAMGAEDPQSEDKPTKSKKGEPKASKSKPKKKDGGQGKTKKKSRQKEAASETVKDRGADTVNYEKDPEMLEILAVSPEAEPLDPNLLLADGLKLTDMPDGLLLSRCEGDIKINIMTTLGRADAHIRQDEVRRLGLKPSRVRNFEDLEASGHFVKPLEKGENKDVVSLSEGLNAGVKPGSRRFIRGVLHPDPGSIYAAGLSCVLLALAILLNVFGIPLAMLYRIYLGEENSTAWVIGLLISLIATIAGYLYFSCKARCRVCGQRPLLPKKCIRHKKAHHFPGLGNILPTALQAVLFKWFYCTYCGTAIRLKK